MQFIVQLVNHQTGQRSEEFITTAPDLARILRDQEELDQEDHILVLASVDKTAEEQHQLQFTRTPIMSIESFLAATKLEEIDHPNKLNGNAPEEKANG